MIVSLSYTLALMFDERKPNSVIHIFRCSIHHLIHINYEGSNMKPQLQWKNVLTTNSEFH